MINHSTFKNVIILMSLDLAYQYNPDIFHDEIDRDRHVK